MNKNELIHNLKGGNVQVTFKKIDGDIRKMLCTLQEDVIPKTTGKKKENKDVLAVWDLGKNAWRSFRLDSIKKVELVTEHAHK
tara:strand:- start:28 stop:276 length:249 start_codon:yes stop_codon:yes gene_type:complete